MLSQVAVEATTTRAFSYDAAGNTTQDLRGSTAYNSTINNAGRISQLAIGTTVTASYSYDGKDRLSVRQTLNMTPAGATQYLYDQWDHIVAETNGAGTVVKQYVWVGDMPVAVLDGTTTPATPTVLYVHADHLNRPEMMTNASQAVVWKAVYEPFGAVVSITGTASNNGCFPGQWYQLEAGLHYNWHRYYDPSLGRYTTPDPLGVGAGASVFGYAGQSPLMRTDFRGLDNPLMGPYDPPGPPELKKLLTMCSPHHINEDADVNHDPNDEPIEKLKPLPGLQVSWHPPMRHLHSQVLRPARNQQQRSTLLARRSLRHGSRHDGRLDLPHGRPCRV